MKFDAIYVISQIFVLITYTFGALTFFTKKRKRILTLNFLALGSDSIAYVLLSAYTGLAMLVVAAIRNILLLRFDKEKDQLRNLIIVYILIIVSTIFTYNGISSLVAMFSCLLYTYAIWQKDTKRYKMLAIPISISWIIYNVYIYSIFTVICESILIVSAIVGLIRDKKVK